MTSRVLEVQLELWNDNTDPCKSPLKIPVARTSPVHSHLLPTTRHTRTQHLTAQRQWRWPRVYNKANPETTHLNTAGPIVSSDPPVTTR